MPIPYEYITSKLIMKDVKDGLLLTPSSSKYQRIKTCFLLRNINDTNSKNNPCYRNDITDPFLPFPTNDKQ